MKTLLLFNPRAAPNKPRIPNSILQVAASVCSDYQVCIVDGNLETDPEKVVLQYMEKYAVSFVGFTVMPGPQLKQAIPIARKVKSAYPHIPMIWGGYFPSNHPEVVLNSGFVDFIINGMGDEVFPRLLQCIEANDDYSQLPNLIYKDSQGAIHENLKTKLPDMDALNPLPYDILHRFYPIPNYLGRTFLGSRTLAYHSSFGCPFTCSFCAVVPIYNARWKGQSAQTMLRRIEDFNARYGATAIEFTDNNFFVSEARTVEFARSLTGKGIGWWGEGRIDTLHKYKDESLQILAESGCKMIFFGAETGDDTLLKKVDKGGTQSREQIIAFAARLQKFGIIPEYSFVLGWPGENARAVMKQIKKEIAFIREVKRVNPATEIILYIYSPVPVKGSDMFEKVEATGFSYPERLDDWISPAWEKFDLRKNPATPWLKPRHIRKVRNFETVLHGMYPTVSDTRMTGWKKVLLRLLSAPRYFLGMYFFPYEIKVFHRIFKYRQPEITGFYNEADA